MHVNSGKGHVNVVMFAVVPILCDNIVTEIYVYYHDNRFPIKCWREAWYILYHVKDV